MKILITTSFYPPYYVGGDATHCKALAEELVKKGHEVHVFFSEDAYNLKGPKIKIQGDKVDYRGVIPHKIKSPLGRLEPLLNYTLGTQYYTYKEFKKIVKKENFDLIHHHNIWLLGHKLLRKIGSYKSIYTAHDYWLICPKSDLLRNKKICHSNKGINCYTCCLSAKRPSLLSRLFGSFKRSTKDIEKVISPSKYLATKLKVIGGVKGIEVISNFSQNISSNKPAEFEDYFLFVGRIEETKGVIPLIKSFTELNKKLVLVGDGNLRSEVEKYSKEYKNIIFLGFCELERVYGLMKHANALILPSQWPENNPMVIIESYMLGTPAIASNLGGNPELIEILDPSLVFVWNDFESLKKIIKNYKKEKYKNIPRLDFHSYYLQYQKLLDL